MFVEIEAEERQSEAEERQSEAMSFVKINAEERQSEATHSSRLRQRGDKGRRHVES